MAAGGENPKLKSTKGLVRSVLMSVKEGVPASQFLRDYQNVTGETIPVKQLGFSNVGDFIKSIPDVVFVKQVAGQLIYFAVADETTQHIQSLIQRQKTNIKKSKGLKKGQSRFPKYHSQVSRFSRSGYRPPLLAKPSGGGFHRPYQGFSSSPSSFSSFSPSPSPQSRSPAWPSHFSSSTVSPLMVTVRNQGKQGGEGTERTIERKAATGNRQVALRGFREALKQISPEKRPVGNSRTFEVPPRFLKNNANVPSAQTGDKPVAGMKRAASAGTEYEANGNVNGSSAESLVVQPSPQNQKEMEEIDTRPMVTEDQLPDNIKEWTVKMLKDHRGGLWSTRFNVLYKSEFHQDAPRNLIDIVQGWTDIARVELNSVASRRVLYAVLEKKWENYIVPIAELFEAEEVTEVYASYMLDLNHFYLQDAESCAEDITAKLGEIYQDLVVPKAKDLLPGVFCAALYSVDDSWYRARVLFLQEDQVKVQVMFIDYGNVETVDISNIRCLTKETAMIPAQAVGCVMFALKPFEGQNGWSEDAKFTFHNLMASKKLKAYTYKIEEGNCVVELWSDDEKKSLNEQLYEGGLVDTYLPRNPDPPELEVPQEGYVEVVLAFMDLNHCWLRLIGPDFSDQLDKFEDKLSTLYKSAEGHHEFEEGNICIVHSELFFHRVKVIELVENKTKANCFFLDHGYTECFPVTQLVPLDIDVNRSLAYQAVNFVLVGLENHMSNPITVVELVEICRNKICIAEIITREPLKVMVYDTYGSDDVNINELIATKLLAEGHSIDMTQFRPSPDSSINSDTRSTPEPDSVPQQLSPSSTKSEKATASPPPSVVGGGDGGRGTTGGVSCVSYTLAKCRLEGDEEKSVGVAACIQGDGTHRSPSSVGSSVVSPLQVTERNSAASNSMGNAAGSHPPVVSPSGDQQFASYDLWSVPPYLPLPQIREFFDVFVQSISDPSSFVVVPRKLLRKLEDMMKEINVTFSADFAQELGHSASSVQKAVPASTPSSGHLYLTFYENVFYRAIYISTKDSMHHVYLPDYCEHVMVEGGHLYFLPQQFWTQPFMAFRGCLHGLRPAGGSPDGKWPESAKYKFAQLAENEYLVALMHEVVPLVGGEAAGLVGVSSQKLAVNLINTMDPDKDVVISEALVEAGLATMVNE